MIKITARINGFRRCGVAHYGIREYPDYVWTPEQLATLKADPMLVVEIIQDQDPAPPGPAAELPAPKLEAEGKPPLDAPLETKAQEPAPEAEGEPPVELPPAPEAPATPPKPGKGKKK